MQKKLYQTLFVLMSLALLSCQTVSVPNTRVVTVSGRMSAGAIWGETLSPKTGDMTLEEFIEFLEPQEEIRSSTGELIQEARGPAMCLSTSDLNRLKTALEKACRKLGRLCSYEMKELIKESSGNIDRLQKISTSELSKGLH